MDLDVEQFLPRTTPKIFTTTKNFTHSLSMNQVADSAAIGKLSSCTFVLDFDVCVANPRPQRSTAACFNINIANIWPCGRKEPPCMRGPSCPRKGSNHNRSACPATFSEPKRPVYLISYSCLWFTPPDTMNSTNANTVKLSKIPYIYTDDQ